MPEPSRQAQLLSSSVFRRQACDKLGPECRLFRAPGRVNLIGEHTDYNQGLVMPVAINRYTYAGAVPARAGEIHLESREFEDIYTAKLEMLQPEKGWGNYLLGMAAGLQQRGYKLRGTRLYVQSEIPFGAGLSSSAALEISSGLAMLGIAQTWPHQGMDMVWAAHFAEHHFVGALTGIMDQFIATFGRKEHALMLDCRSLEWEPVPLPAECELVICNTGVRHALAASAYNQRRHECQLGVEHFQRRLPEVQSLRDVTWNDFLRWQTDLPDAVMRRCRHIISENRRVEEARRAFQQHDLSRLSELFSASHRSLRDDYEVSCPELDAMVEAAAQAPGFIAGRMTGGGFGGCTVNLVYRAQVSRFIASVSAAYRSQMNHIPEIWAVESADGGGELALVNDQELLIRAAT